MTRRILVMTLMVGLPRLLKWARREAKFQQIRATLRTEVRVATKERFRESKEEEETTR